MLINQITFFFPVLLLILSVNNPTHMYLSDLKSVFQSRSVFQSNLKEQKQLVYYANTTNVKFICWPDGFIPWLINLQLFASI